MYIRNKDNIIEGNNDIEIINNKKQTNIESLPHNLEKIFQQLCFRIRPLS